MQLDKRSLELYLLARERQAAAAPRRWANPCVTAVAAAALVCAGLWYIPGNPTGFGSELQVLASIPGRAALPSASADGRTILFSASADGQAWEVYTAAAGQAQATQLTHDAQRTYSAVIHPDGQSFAYITRNDPLSIGIRPLEPDAPPRILATREGLRRIVWHPNGKWIFASVEGPFAGLFAISVEAAVWQRLTRPAAPNVDGDLAVSPDGRYLAFTRGESATRGRLLVAPLTADNALAAEPATLVDTLHAGNPAWSRDGKALYFTLGERDLELRRAYPDRPGAVDRVEAGAMPGGEIFASARGLLLTRQHVQREHWRWDFQSKRRTVVETPPQTSHPFGPYTDIVRVLRAPKAGRALLVRRSKLTLLSLPAGETLDEWSFPPGFAAASFPEVSADGRYLFFIDQAAEPGRLARWELGAAASPDWLPPTGVRAMAWIPASNRLLLRHGPGNLGILDLDQPAAGLLPLASGVAANGLAATATAAYYVAHPADNVAVFYEHPFAGERRELFRQPGFGPVEIGVSPDGGSVQYSRTTSETGQIVLAPALR